MNNHALLPSVSNAQLPATYENAKTALAECSSIDECKSWSDKAAALASYARQSKDDTMRKMAERIQARAIRRAGELLKQIMPAKNQHSAGVGGGTSRKQAGDDAGLSDRQRNNALRVATIPEGEFTAMVESDNPPTLTKLAEIGTKKQLVDLKGRDPKEFNKAMHFIGLFDDHLRRCGKANIDVIASILTNEEREKLRSIINKIDTIHDQLMTRV